MERVFSEQGPRLPRHRGSECKWLGRVEGLNATTVGLGVARLSSTALLVVIIVTGYNVFQ